jgi:copper homeostasis protein CutC
LVIFKQLSGITSDSIKLITEFGSPGMTRSLGLIKQIVSTAQRITESIEDPEMKKNIENMNITIKAMRDSRDRIQNVSRELKDTHLIEEVRIITSSVKTRTDQTSLQDLRELIIALKGTISSLKRLANEITS